MKTKLTYEWFVAAGIRALKTMAQTALGMFSVGLALQEVQWQYVVSVAIVAGIYSLLTSFATKLPEVGTDGVLQIDTTKPEESTYKFIFDYALQELKEHQIVKLKVEPGVALEKDPENGKTVIES